VETGPVRHGSRSSGGSPDTTPGAGTPGSARSARSPTSSDQLRWPPPHDDRCPRSGGRALGQVEVVWAGLGRVPVPGVSRGTLPTEK
jgi:hypothetical protein